MRRYSVRMRRSVGRPLISEITLIGVPTAWYDREGNTGSGVNQLAAPRPCGVGEPVHARTLYVREPGDLSDLRQAAQKPERLEKACGYTSNAYVTEKSDTNIVPEKEPNNAVLSQDSSGGSGGKGGDQGEFLRSAPVTCTRRQGKTLSGLDRIRAAAAKDKSLRFTSLMHRITVDLLRDSYKSLKRDAASGIDNVTRKEYGEQLEIRSVDLHNRVQSGSYRAMPSKRIRIPKPDGRERPAGIATLEDKIVQYAAVRVLNRIYEETFLGFSYGFRPGRHQHNAPDALWVGIMRRKVGRVLDADISGFFDAIEHGRLMKFIEHRVADPGMLNLIRKWLGAGVSEEGRWSKTEVGTSQGAVISPLPANIYLHLCLGPMGKPVA